MLEKNDPKFTQAKWREGYFYSDPSIVEARSGRSGQGRPAGKVTSGLRSRSQLNNGHRTRLAARKEAVKQTLLDTLPNLDDHRFEDWV